MCCRRRTTPIAWSSILPDHLFNISSSSIEFIFTFHLQFIYKSLFVFQLLYNYFYFYFTKASSLVYKTLANTCENYKKHIGVVAMYIATKWRMGSVATIAPKGPLEGRTDTSLRGDKLLLCYEATKLVTSLRRIISPKDTYV